MREQSQQKLASKWTIGSQQFINDQSAVNNEQTIGLPNQQSRMVSWCLYKPNRLFWASKQKARITNATAKHKTTTLTATRSSINKWICRSHIPDLDPYCLNPKLHLRSQIKTKRKVVSASEHIKIAGLPALRWLGFWTLRVEAAGASHCNNFHQICRQLKMRVARISQNKLNGFND